MRFVFIIFSIVFVLVWGESAFADERHDHSYPVAPKGYDTDKQLIVVERVGNRVCPVSGEEIKEGKEVTYEYKGKIYNFCCTMCLKDFKKDPEKFSKIAEEKASQ